MKKSKKVKSSDIRIFYIALIAVYLYLFFAGFYRYNQTNKFSSCAVEIFFIIVLSCIIAYSLGTKKQRKNIFEKLMLVFKKENKKDRIKNYIAESIILALLITTCIFSFISYDIIYVNFYSILDNPIVAIFLIMILIFVASFTILFILEYLINEKLLGKARLKTK